MNIQDILVKVSERNPKNMVVVYIDPKTGQAVSNFAGSMESLTYMSKALDCLIHDLLTGRRQIMVPPSQSSSEG